MNESILCILCKKHAAEPGYFVCNVCFSAGIVACRACNVRAVDGQWDFCADCWNSKSAQCKLCPNPAAQGELLCSACWNRVSHCPVCRVSKLGRGWDLCESCFKSGARLCPECREPLSLSAGKKICSRCTLTHAAAVVSVSSTPTSTISVSTASLSSISPSPSPSLSTSTASSAYSNAYCSAAESAAQPMAVEGKKSPYDEAPSLKPAGRRREEKKTRRLEDNKGKNSQFSSFFSAGAPTVTRDSTTEAEDRNAEALSAALSYPLADDTATKSNLTRSAPPFAAASSASLNSHIPCAELEVDWTVPPLGSGAFGRVVLGKYNKAPVAIKVLHFTTPELVDQVLKEADMLKTLTDRGHPNVLRYFGICRLEAPYYSYGIVTEFLPNGSLKHFLEKHKDSVKLWQLVNFAKGTAAGMLHLSSHKPPVLHRDLSAKNILIGQREEDGSYVLRVADFGLSRINEGYSISSSSVCPVRWTAPEVWVKQRIYTVASDVWAFGVCLWEIVTFGEQPYHSLSDPEVKDHLRKGTLRLDQSPLIPPAIWQLICQCCQPDPKDRPDFAKLYTSLESLEKEYRVKESR